MFHRSKKAEDGFARLLREKSPKATGGKTVLVRLFFRQFPPHVLHEQTRRPRQAGTPCGGDADIPVLVHVKRLPRHPIPVGTGAQRMHDADPQTALHHGQNGVVGTDLIVGFGTVRKGVFPQTCFWPFFWKSR